MHHMSLISIALPKPFTRQKIETYLDCSLQKGVEKAFFAHDQERYIIFTQFNIITFINYTKEELLEALHKLHLKHARRYEEFYLFQDYPIISDADFTPNWIADEILEFHPRSLFDGVEIEDYQKKELRLCQYFFLR